MDILPPELLGDTSQSTATSKKFDRSEFFPSSLTDGESNTFRLLGHYGTGHAAVYWRFPVEQMKDGELKFAGFKYTSEYPGAQPEGIARATDWSNPARPKLADTYVKPRQAVVWVAFSVERQRPELLILEQRSLREGIVEALGDEDFTFKDDGTAEFLMKITRRGTGLETSYSILPKAKAPTKVETNAMGTVKDVQVSALLEGRHPLVEPAAQFSSASTEEAEF